MTLTADIRSTKSLTLFLAWNVAGSFNIGNSTLLALPGVGKSDLVGRVVERGAKVVNGVADAPGPGEGYDRHPLASATVVTTARFSQHAAGDHRP
jgi:hypothetical protein